MHKAYLYLEVEQVDWSYPLEANDIGDAVTRLETKFLRLIEACVPPKTMKNVVT